MALLCCGATHAADSRTVLVVGDSLSAAFGINQSDGWVALLQRRLQTEFPGVTVVNASISGDTTANGLARIDAALTRHTPGIVIIELGGNDGMRGLPLKQMRDNLRQMIQRAQRAGAKVLLLGMRIPTNYGPAYTRAFESAYSELARQFSIPLVPFFLDGIALDPKLMQDDGIHPTAQAQQKMFDNVWPVLRPLLGGG